MRVPSRRTTAMSSSAEHGVTSRGCAAPEVGEPGVEAERGDAGRERVQAQLGVLRGGMRAAPQQARAGCAPDQATHGQQQPFT